MKVAYLQWNWNLRCITVRHAAQPRLVARSSTSSVRFRRAAHHDAGWRERSSHTVGDTPHGSPSCSMILG
jgi:hypothetical protein